MAALNVAATTALYKERYRAAVPYFGEQSKTFYAKLKKRANVEKVGRRTIRAAKKTKLGGQFRTFSDDGGDLGRGSGSVYEVTTMTTLPFLIALEKTKAAEWETATSELAIKNAVQDQITDGTGEYATHIDRHLMGNGNGVLSTVLSGGGTATLVMTTPIRSRRLREQNWYQVYDATIMTNRGRVLVDTNDEGTGTVTLVNSPVNPVVATIVNTDVLLIENASGVSPASLQGLAYHHNSSVTGFWMGLNRANFPQVRTSEVAAGGSLQPSHLRTLMSKMALNRDDIWTKAGAEWQWFLPIQPPRGYYELSLQITTRRRDGPADRKGPELLDNVDEMRINGMSCMISPNADPSRIDLINWTNWWKGQTKELGMYEIDGIDTFPVYGASGGIATADLEYLCELFNAGVDDPRQGGFVSGLTTPF